MVVLTLLVAFIVDRTCITTTDMNNEVKQCMSLWKHKADDHWTWVVKFGDNGTTNKELKKKISFLVAKSILCIRLKALVKYKGWLTVANHRRFFLL